MALNRTILAALALCAALPVIPAAATTSGGFSATTYGPPAFTGGRVYLPVQYAMSPERGIPATTGSRIESFSEAGPAPNLQLPGKPGAPSVGASADSAYAAWAEGEHLRAARIKPDGLGLEAPLDLDFGTVKSGPLVAAGPGGRIALVWQDDASAVHLRTIAPDGTPGADNSFPAGRPTASQPAFDGSGMAWLSWQDGGRLNVAGDGNGAPGQIAIGHSGWETVVDPAGSGVYALVNRRTSLQLYKVAPGEPPQSLATIAAPRHTSVRGELAVGRSGPVIAFTRRSARRHARSDLYLWRSEGTRRLTRTPRYGEILGDAAISSDGATQVLFSGDDANSYLLGEHGSRKRLGRDKSAGELLADGEGRLLAVLTSSHQEEENEDGGGSNPDLYGDYSLLIVRGGRVTAAHDVTDGTNTY